jgi:hypothetical protein
MSDVTLRAEIAALNAAFRALLHVVAQQYESEIGLRRRLRGEAVALLDHAPAEIRQRAKDALTALLS